METTDRLTLSYVIAAQAQKHVPVNETTRALDALVHLSVASATTGAEPQSPAAGEGYILPAGATGTVWETFSAGDVVVFQDGAWAAYRPVTGMTAFVEDEGAYRVWSGGVWVQTGQEAGQFGVNTSPDATNRLAVKSDAVLHSHDDITPGSGDVRHVLNMATSANTASHLFQVGFSARAEFGLTGSEDFVIKVSPDGSTFHDAIVIDRTTGAVSFPNTADLGTTVPTFSPDEAPGLVSWYDVGDSATVTQSGGTVSALADKGTGGNTATQMAAALQPVLDPGGLAGRDALSFGGGEWLEVHSLASLVTGEDRPYTVHIVTSRGTADSAAIGAARAASTTPQWWIGAGQNAEIRSNRRDDSFTQSSVEVDVTDDQVHVISLVFDGTSTDIWVDGVKSGDARAQNVGGLTLDTFLIGGLPRAGSAVLPFHGKIGEILIYDRAQSTADLKSVHGWLVGKWLSPPSEIDLFLMIGQSNMAGRGDASASPQVPAGRGFAYASDGEFLPMADPVGLGDSRAQSGSLLPAFANGWYAGTGRAMVAVPKAVGGSALLAVADAGTGNWDKVGGTLYTAATTAFAEASANIAANTIYTVAGTYVGWAQGEAEAVQLGGTSPPFTAGDYEQALNLLFTQLKTDLPTGFVHGFIFELGVLANTPGDPNWGAIRDAQGAVGAGRTDVDVVATSAKTLHLNGGMSADNIHWNQSGLNQIGAEGATDAVAGVTA